MDSISHNLAEFLQNHQTWAALIIGLLCFAESLIVVGWFVPAVAILMTTGSLIGAGILDNYFSIFVAGVLGAYLGDNVSYWIGQYYGYRLLRKPSFTEHRKTIAKTRLFFNKFGSISVFIGRFMGPMRCLAPTMAGIFKMKRLNFQLANILSAIIWFPFMLSWGYFGAKGANALSTNIVNNNIATVLLIATLISLIAGIWGIKTFLVKKTSK